ncbi:hypothetical protein C8R48DRAFT_677145 [Suillus tomentosus]|nr:hypothetical protein C8R48DRAFT_677145 [Suillus tomentosus]
MPPDVKPLAFILYADKVKLFSFGREKGYPVIARLANLTIAIRNGKGVGGGWVVGWLPLIKDDPKHKVVWHAAFKKVLASIVPPSTSGRWVNCWDNIVRLFYTLVLILSVDYEEHFMFKGYNNAFHDMNHKTTDVHCALSHDRLHVDILGFFGDHMWSKLQLLIGLLGHDKVAQVDEKRNLIHFDAMMAITFTDGSYFQAHAVLPNAGESKLAYLLLWCICAYLEVDRYTMLKNWSFPKKHLVAHLFDDIMAKGATRNYNTMSNEKCHGPLKASYQYQTNFKDVAPQMAKDKTDPDTNVPSNFHVRFRSKQPKKSLETIEEQHVDNPFFRHFCRKLNTFLNTLPAVTQHVNMLLFDNHSHMTHPEKITEFRFLKVN